MNPEAAALRAKAAQSLAAADLLARDGYFDFATARVYYAMFYLAEGALLDEGIAVSSHREVHSQFFHRFVAPGKVSKQVHKCLVRGFEMRQEGDYSSCTMITAEEFESLRREADEFARALAALAPGN